MRQAETVPNQDGASAAKTARSPDPAHVGRKARGRGAQTQQRTTGYLARAAAGARSGPSRSGHAARWPSGTVAPLRTDLRDAADRSRGGKSARLSRPSLLGAGRSCPSRGRSGRSQGLRARHPGPRRPVRRSDQSRRRTPWSRLERPLPRARLAYAARDASRDRLRPAELPKTPSRATRDRSPELGALVRRLGARGRNTAGPVTDQTTVHVASF